MADALGVKRLKGISRRLYRSPNLRLVIDIVAIFAIIYFSFRIIYSHELTKFTEELANALLGAIATALITYLLITRQFQSEELKERNVEVFKKKADNFINFIDELWEKWSDFTIDPEEVEKIRKRFYKTVYVYLSKDGLQEVADALSELKAGNYIGRELKGVERMKARSIIFRIISRLKQEMGLPGDFDNEPLDVIDTAFDKVEHESKTKEEQSKSSTGKSSWHFALYDGRVEEALLDNENDRRLVCGDEENGNRTGLLKKIPKGDIIFAYARGRGYIGIFEAVEPGRILPKRDPERRFMAPDDGEEGQVKVKALVVLSPTDCVKRDAPRLKTIQRIYDPKAITTLINGFRKKAEEQGLSWPEDLDRIEQDLERKKQDVEAELEDTKQGSLQS